MFSGSLSEVARFVANSLACETEVDYFRDAGLRRDGDTYVLVWLSPPFKDKPEFNWEPGENEAKITVEPCPERGSYCFLCEGPCLLGYEIDCTTQRVADMIYRAFLKKEG